MKPTLVYRVEHKVGDSGPYAACWQDYSGNYLTNDQRKNLKNICANFLHDEKRHPSPDYFIDVFGSNHFGFKTIKQFQKWFTYDVCKKLKRLGFVLSVYECSERNSLKKQCTFNKNKAKLIERIDLTKPELHG